MQRRIGLVDIHSRLGDLYPNRHNINLDLRKNSYHIHRKSWSNSTRNESKTERKVVSRKGMTN